jgi:hypothetical protein
LIRRDSIRPGEVALLKLNIQASSNHGSTMPDLKLALESDSEILASARGNNQKRQRFVSYLLYSLILILSFPHFLNTLGNVSINYPFFRQSVKAGVGFDWGKVRRCVCN